MEKYRIRVNNEVESKKAQELFIQLGYELDLLFGKYEANTKWVLAFADGSMGCASEALAKDTLREITFPQLRDLVVLKRNDVSDANYKSATDFYYVTVENQYYFWSGFAWCLSDADFIIGLSPIIDNPENKDPALISGADALRALADGKEVEYQNKVDLEGIWFDITESNILDIFTNDRFIFRLKPKTIKLELELPKPFEPKDGEKYYFIHLDNDNGYGFNYFESKEVDSCWMQCGAYKTEEEIKKVVEQLRKIKGAV